MTYRSEIDGLRAIAIIAVLLRQNNEQAPATRVLTNAPALFVGRVSCSLYLWHWPVAVLMAWTVGHGNMALAVAGILASVFLGWLSYRFVEQPARQAQGLRRPGRVFTATGTGVLGAATLIWGIGEASPDPLYAGQKADLLAAGAGSLTDPFNASDGSRWQGAACALTDNNEAGKKIDPNACSLGRFETARQRVLVAGNIYSSAFVQSFDNLGVAGVATVVISSWGASSVPGIENTGPWSKANDAYWQRVIPDLMKDFEAPDTLLLISDLAGFSPLRRSAKSDAKLDDLERGLRALDRLSPERGMKLAMLGPLPFAREAQCEPSLAVPQWFVPGGGPCHFLTRAETKARLQPLLTRLAELQASGIVEVIDIFELFCPGKVCTYLGADDIVLCRDVWSHPSVRAARQTGRIIGKHLRQAAS